MQLISQTSSNGIVERVFTINAISGVLWSPASAPHGAPLLLSGHPGGLDKWAPPHVARAHSAVIGNGFHVATIDAPGHGDRPRSAEDHRAIADFRHAREHGNPEFGRILADFCASVALRAVPEWQETIDALVTLPEIGPSAPIGYSGMSLAGAIGIPLAAVEPRIVAARFGWVSAHATLFEAATRVTIPVEYLLPLDDREIPRPDGLALFDAFSSKDKVLHGFPGRHDEIPADGRLETGFFARHLRHSEPMTPTAAAFGPPPA